MLGLRERDNNNRSGNAGVDMMLPPDDLLQIKRHELGEMVSACEAIDISVETRNRVLETKEEGLERIGDIEVQARIRKDASGGWG